jgi:hypothetical protein
MLKVTTSLSSRNSESNNLDYYSVAKDDEATSPSKTAKPSLANGMGGVGTIILKLNLEPNRVRL